MNSLILFIKYLQFIIKAKHYNGHGVHSPFIYKFVKQVIFDRSNKNKYQIIHNYRKSLLNTPCLIKVVDYGAGSKKLDLEFRKVKDIASISGSKEKYCNLLFRIVSYYKPKNIIELGTSLGIGTLSLALGNNNCIIKSIEGANEIYLIAKKSLNKFKVENAVLVNDQFDNALPKIINELDSLDLVFFDGNHIKKATIDYFNICVDKINNDSIFIFDDIYWSSEMEEAWKLIKAHPKIKVTIDLFQFGIVFFKKELSRQHYFVRY